MKLKQISACLLVATMLLTACSKKGPQYAQYIPKAASYVVAIDVQSMITKLEADSLSVEKMLDVLKDESNSNDYAQALDIWTKFKDAGLDFQNKVLLAIPEINIDKGSVKFQLVAGLQDAAKLEAFVAKLPNAPKIEKQGDISIVNTPDLTLGWNKNAVMIVGADNSSNYGMLDMDSTAPAAIPGGADSKALMIQYFELKKDASLASVKEFGELMEQKADMAVFANSSAVGAEGNPMVAMMPKIKELLDGIYSTTLINFEDGKIVVTSHSYAGPRMAELLKKYAGPVVDMSLLERYPSTNINGVTAFSFKPELLPAFLKETGLDALANVALSEGGTSLDDVSKAFKGDFAVVFSDFAVKALEVGKDANYKSYDPTGTLLVAVRIGDKAAFDKLLSLGEKQQLLRREGNRILPAGDEVAAMASNKVFIGVENDVLIISTDSLTYSSYAGAKASNKVSANIAAAIKGKAMGFYVDVAGILKGIPDGVFDSTDIHEKKILDKSKTVFTDMWFNTDNFDGKKVSGTGEVNMAPGKNALPQLVRYLMFIADEMKAKEKEDEARYKVDVVDVPLTPKSE